MLFLHFMCTLCYIKFANATSSDVRGLFALWDGNFRRTAISVCLSFACSFSWECNYRGICSPLTFRNESMIHGLSGRFALPGQAHVIQIGGCVDLAWAVEFVVVHGEACGTWHNTCHEYPHTICIAQTTTANMSHTTHTQTYTQWHAPNIIDAKVTVNVTLAPHPQVGRRITQRVLAQCQSVNNAQCTCSIG